MTRAEAIKLWLQAWAEMMDSAPRKYMFGNGLWLKSDFPTTVIEVEAEDGNPASRNENTGDQDPA